MTQRNPSDTPTAIEGVYDRYHYSSIYPGQILRAAFCVYGRDRFMQHYYIERFPDRDRPNKAAYIFKYHGMTTSLSGRLFSVDYESAQKNEMTMSIFAPQERSARKFLFGMTMGIAATVLRPPFSARVAMQYRGPGLIKREHIARATILDRNDSDIPVEVREFLGDESSVVTL